MNDQRLIHIHDHGFVRLISPEPSPDGHDLAVVRAARVSYDADWRAGDDDSADERLINYMMKNHHTSPFEAVSLTFEVKAPIFVLRQWHRHRTWSYNELSARYAPLKEDFYIPELEQIGKQSASSKQAREIGAELSQDVKLGLETFRQSLHQRSMEAFELYQDALEFGVPRELARLYLPVNVYSRMFATVNLWNLLRFLEQRLHVHAQYEIRQYAQGMLYLAQTYVAPASIAAFRMYRLGEQHRPELGT